MMLFGDADESDGFLMNGFPFLSPFSIPPVHGDVVSHQRCVAFEADGLIHDMVERLFVECEGSL